MTRTFAFRVLLFAGLPFSAAAAQERLPSLAGIVADSIRHAPLAGATVVATRTDAPPGSGEESEYTATTDARGRYAIEALVAGRYLVTVEHPWLDSTGLSVPARTIDLGKTSTAVLNLAVPSGATIRAAFCRISALDSASGLVAGYVKDARARVPLAGARVVFEWSDFAVDPRSAMAEERNRKASVTTGRDGTFRMCGLPLARPILMQAQFGSRDATGAVEVRIPPSGVLVETLALDTASAGSAFISGHVRGAGSGRPIAGAHVHLYGAMREVLSAPDGSFRLGDVPLGTQSVEVTALGFSPLRLTIGVSRGGVRALDVSLAENGTVLDSVKVVAKRTLTREFDQRSANGEGQYITEAMILKANPLMTADLMQQVSGFYVMQDTVYSSRGVTGIMDKTSHMCEPTLYVDGTTAIGTMNDIAPSSIHGIEVYASSVNVPPQYKSGLCGAIFVWTK